MKLLTITVPCFNSEQYMKKCIDSILAGGERVEIIIINDGSTDRTGLIADEYTHKYPDTIKVIHQINGGHGEGINQGIRHASGTYFKVVDSDDWLGENELRTVLDRLEEVEQEGGIDMLVSNYVYEHNGKRKKRVIRYQNIFPANVVVRWKDTRRFFEHQYLTIHSVAYKTQMLRACGIELPKHVFYEDNLFVYKPLPMVKKILYMDIDLYHYQIGREGQSVAEQALKKRYAHQLSIAKAIFVAHDLKTIRKEEPKLGRYMYHEAKMMLIMATAFARLNKTDQAEIHIKRLWDEVTQHAPEMGKRIRYRSEAALINKPGSIGRSACIMFYKLAKKVVPFN